jgi:hypothetical protein
MIVDVRKQPSKIFNLGVEVRIFIFARQLLYGVDLSKESMRAVSLEDDSGRVSVRQLDNGVIPGS